MAERLKVSVERWTADSWVVRVERLDAVLDEPVKLWPPFRQQGWAETAAATLALAYRQDGYNVVEEANQP